MVVTHTHNSLSLFLSLPPSLPLSLSHVHTLGMRTCLSAPPSLDMHALERERERERERKRERRERERRERVQ
jgi:hypothetical protein